MRDIFKESKISLGYMETFSPSLGQIGGELCELKT